MRPRYGNSVHILSLMEIIDFIKECILEFISRRVKTILQTSIKLAKGCFCKSYIDYTSVQKHKLFCLFFISLYLFLLIKGKFYIFQKIMIQLTSKNETEVAVSNTSFTSVLPILSVISCLGLF